MSPRLAGKFPLARFRRSPPDPGNKQVTIDTISKQHSDNSDNSNNSNNNNNSNKHKS